jgi:ABC-type multidrug transport system fused ATPase/permease subunit
MVLSGLADAIVSLGRLAKFFLAEELMNMPKVDPSHDMALSANGDFEWDVVSGIDGGQVVESKGNDNGEKPEERKEKGEGEKRIKEETRSDGTRWKFWKANKARGSLPLTMEFTGASEGNHRQDETPFPAAEEKPFGLKDLRLEIGRGAFVAIVGSVGSGKV